jgi:hypothetical protein
MAMDKWLEQFARSMGADFICQLPFDPAGPDGAARLAQFYKQRMAELRRQDAAAQSAAQGAPSLKLSLSEAAVRGLAELARLTSPAGQEGDPVQLATVLLEQMGPVLLDEIKRTQAGPPSGADREILAEEVGLKVMQFLRSRVRSSRQAG